MRLMLAAAAYDWDGQGSGNNNDVWHHSFDDFDVCDACTALESWKWLGREQ
jgi:hypothetical protein